LIALGRRAEAQQHYEAAVKVFQELGSNTEFGLVRSWREMQGRARQAEPAPSETASLEASKDVAPESRTAPVASPSEAGPTPLVGRETEWKELIGLLDATNVPGNKVILLTAEPGLGKTRLIEELLAVARQRGVRTFSASAYEMERDHPYGLWIEGWYGMPDNPHPLFPLAAPSAEGADIGELVPTAGHERFLAAAAQAVLGDVGSPLLIALDDVQWCDEASINLLHYIIRLGRSRALGVLLAAREGELADNPKMLTVLRSLRHARILHEVRLAPLTAEAIERIVQTSTPSIDVQRVVAECGGNPLFALEISRNLINGHGVLPRSLKEMVRDRIERLPSGAADLLRWASVVGPSFSINQLLPLLDISVDVLMAHLEVLERHALLREVASGQSDAAYRFGHDLVHRAIYTGISEPRRKLMHLKVARILHADGAHDELIAPDIVHHAALAGDASMAASACVKAGRRSLRVFANAQAAAIAKRGMRFAEMLPEREQVGRTMELIQIEFLAQRPDDPSAVVSRLEQLSERALDLDCFEHARLGYHILSYIRWEGGLWAGAQRDTMRAEVVSRSANEKQRVIAMAETARCLAMLERDLDQAEALVLEAQALGHQLGIEPSAIADASGMLRAQQGSETEAARLFGRAREAARRDGDRAGEFLALEHLTCLELQNRRFAAAEPLCAELIELAEKLRGGSEAPFAHALDALCRLARKDSKADSDLEQSLTRLRHADAKHRLAFTLLVASEIDMTQGRLDRAQPWTQEALQMALLLERPTEIILAYALLARVAMAQGDAERYQRSVSELRERLAAPVSRHVRMAAEAIIDGGSDVLGSRTRQASRRAPSARTRLR